MAADRASNQMDNCDSNIDKEYATLVGTDDEDFTYVPPTASWFRNFVNAIFPDGQPPLWLALNLCLIFAYTVFNVNSYGGDEQVIRPQGGDQINYSVNVLWCLLFILAGNCVMYLCMMIFRFILLKSLLYLRMARYAYVFATISMLDPCIFYVMWAATQAIVWQILVARLQNQDALYIIDSYLLSEYVKKHLIFKEEGLVWVSCAVHVHLILGIRCMVLSLVSFAFELNLLVTSNEALKRYLRLCANIRKFNIDWLELVMSRPEIVDRITKAFACKNVGNKLSPIIERCNPSIYDFHSAFALRILNESHDVAYMQYFNSNEDLSVPSDSADALVEQSSNSTLSNWLLICYVMRVPPVISLLCQDVALRDVNLVPQCASMLFEQMYFTLIKSMSVQPEDRALSSAITSGVAVTPEDAKGKISEDPNSSAETVSGPVDTPVVTEAQKDATPRDQKSSARDNVNSDANNPPSARAVDTQSQQPLGTNENITASQPAVKPASKSRNNRLVSVMKINEFRNQMHLTLTEGAKECSTNAIAMADYQFNSVKDHDDRFISLDDMRSFLNPDEADTIMRLLDLSGHGRINMSMLQQTLQNLYTARKKFKNIIKGQDSIFRVLLRLLSCGTWIFAVVVMAFLSGITAEAIVVSGAALMSALTVALSYLYTNFMTSVIFVAISNPYNVGDRVRLNDGEPLIVKKIRTYTTEFVTILGKGLVYQNATLSSMKITNESRAVRATFNYDFHVDTETTEEQLSNLGDYLVGVCNSRPNDFVKNGLSIYYVEVNPGHSLKLSIWVTCIEGWGNWQRIFQLRSDIMEATMKHCRENNITYTLPAQPIVFHKTPHRRGGPRRHVVHLNKHT
ncbi:Mechanosensitive ion channel family protein [Babesia bovis T2Bo]|uniref:Mechanosensitive ion channel family protein n=1 Tax=Babesia bovis T2Bo TaxID=484906 RepID=UPI001C369B5B|nr:Mechanosensitive ion channel family protein [Babesia bovis T2Bo]EDO06311.2 Mechanosensitive ion channel family protein [Babesia bovis T2Bo]